MDRPLMHKQGEVDMIGHQTAHVLVGEANNVLWVAEATGVGVYAREAPEFAPETDNSEDTVIVVLRGEAARTGRKALVAVADLLR